jgi:hypothetical protein
MLQKVDSDEIFLDMWNDTKDAEKGERLPKLNIVSDSSSCAEVSRKYSKLSL